MQAQAQQLEEVVVTGIRASLHESLETKREANAVVEAVSAEDLGEFPNTNIAEAMTQVPGVAIDRRFGQGERVSIDGTDPSLNLTFLDGHPVAQSIWLFGEQPNRGFDQTQIASEIIGRIEIYKSPEARLPEGSLGGTVLMHTRRPLELEANTFAATGGLNYNDQAEEEKPSVSGLYSWKNSAETWGIAVAAQHYEEQVDRQGAEIFGYQPASIFANAAGVDPDAQVPNFVNAAWFQQTRERDSVALNLQLKPSEALELNLSGLYIKEDFANYNQSMYNFLSLTRRRGRPVDGRRQRHRHRRTFRARTASCSTTTTCAIPSRRPKALDLQAAWYGDGWSRVGPGRPEQGRQRPQAVVHRAGLYRRLQLGHQQGHHVRRSGGGARSGELGRGRILRQPRHLRDRSQGQLRAGRFQHGVRRHVQRAACGRAPATSTRRIFRSTSMASLPSATWRRSERSASPISRALLRIMASTCTQAAATCSIGSTRPRRTSPIRMRPASSTTPSTIEQTNSSAYAQLNFGKEQRLHGNFGVRYVKAEIESTAYNLGSDTPVLPALPEWLVTQKNEDDYVLPSLNLAFDATDDVVLRFAAAKVVAWAPYNQMAPNTFLNDTTLTGAGGNADLGPYESTNYNVSAEWYFAAESVVAASVFYKDIDNFIESDAGIERQFNSISDDADPTAFQNLVATGACTPDGFCNYSILRPRNAGNGEIKGVNLSYQQPFGETGFGIVANYTFADGETAAGNDLPFQSENQYNISPYYERDPFSARVTYGWRSEYLAGGFVAGAPPVSVDAYADLGLSLGWKFNDMVAVEFRCTEPARRGILPVFRGEIPAGQSLQDRAPLSAFGTVEILIT